MKNADKYRAKERNRESGKQRKQESSSESPSNRLHSQTKSRQCIRNDNRLFVFWCSPRVRELGFDWEWENRDEEMTANQPAWHRAWAKFLLQIKWKTFNVKCSIFYPFSTDLRTKRRATVKNKRNENRSKKESLRIVVFFILFFCSFGCVFACMMQHKRTTTSKLYAKIHKIGWRIKHQEYFFLLCVCTRHNKSRQRHT